MPDTAIKCIIPLLSPLSASSPSPDAAPPMTMKAPPSLSLHGACWLPSQSRQRRVACDMQFTDARRRFEDKRGDREGASLTHSLFLKHTDERLPGS